MVVERMLLSEENLKKLSKSDRMEVLLHQSAVAIEAQEDASHLLSALELEVNASSAGRPATGQEPPPSTARSSQGKGRMPLDTSGSLPNCLFIRPGTGESHRPCTSAPTRPCTGASSRPGTGSSKYAAGSRPSTATLLALGHSARDELQNDSLPVGALAEVTNDIDYKLKPRLSKAGASVPLAELQRSKVKGRRHDGNARAAQSSISSVMSWD